MTADTLSEELYRFLLEAMYDMPPRERMNAQWVMSPEWWNECRKMTGPDGRHLWEVPARVEGPEFLLGKLVEVRENGGAPHLETR